MIIHINIFVYLHDRSLSDFRIPTIQAHQSLVDLENSRDDLLFELHRIGHQNSRDRQALTQSGSGFVFLVIIWITASVLDL